MQNAFSLPPELSIYTVGALRAQWLARLGDAPVVDGAQAAPDDVCRLDGAAVGEVDAAGLQLLLSLSNAVARQQRTLVLVAASRPLADACAALGLAHLLADTHLGGGAQ